MKETGIIMSGDHPLKCLDGTKTQTRRVIKPQPTKPLVYRTVRGRPELEYWYEPDNGGIARAYDCPYGQVGDRLRVKETWATENCYNHLKPSEIPQSAKIFYLATDGYDPFKMGIVRPSIFMPRWASRILLEITEVRAEKLQSITEEDTKAEGVNGYLVEKLSGGNDYRVFKEYHHDAYPLIDHADIGDIVRFIAPNLGYAAFQSRNPKCNTGALNIPGKEVFNYVGSIEPNYKRAFKILWDSLNAKRGYGWESNPCLWVISFKLLKVAPKGY